MPTDHERMSIRAISVSVMAASLVLVAMTGCGLLGAHSGPLQTLAAGGQPDFGVGWALDGPGQSADFTAFVFNHTHSPVTLVSARLIPIPGRPGGRLVHEAVALHHDGISGAGGWPPRIPMEPFRGARLPYGQSNIVFGLEGARAGRDYLAAGLRITYRYHGKLYTTPAWAASADCVTRDLNESMTPCERAGQTANQATQKLAAKG
jgi:hypothetical protein